MLTFTDDVTASKNSLFFLTIQYLCHALNNSVSRTFDGSASLRIHMKV